VIDRRRRAPEGPVRQILEQDIFGEFEVKTGRIGPALIGPTQSTTSLPKTASSKWVLTWRSDIDMNLLYPPFFEASPFFDGGFLSIPPQSE